MSKPHGHTSGHMPAAMANFQQFLSRVQQARRTLHFKAYSLRYRRSCADRDSSRKTPTICDVACAPHVQYPQGKGAQGDPLNHLHHPQSTAISSLLFLCSSACCLPISRTHTRLLLLQRWPSPPSASPADLQPKAGVLLRVMHKWRARHWWQANTHLPHLGPPQMGLQLHTPGCKGHKGSTGHAWDLARKLAKTLHLQHVAPASARLRAYSASRTCHDMHIRGKFAKPYISYIDCAVCS